MSASLYWMHGGGCGGDTWSLFNSESPDLPELLTLLDVEVLWHPTISDKGPQQLQGLHEEILSGRRALDVLCLEGSVMLGPGGSGMADTLLGRPKKDLLAELAARANYVVAVGTCASFGGFGKETAAEATGLQYHADCLGGFLGDDFRSRKGLPVINLPGCPCHCEVVAGTLGALVGGAPLILTEHNSPSDWYGILVHQGCTRNEYHEYRVEEKRFGEKGCLFFYMGCHGPLAMGSCNKTLWNRRSSKTRVGVPCFGCTRPDFPQSYPFFKTRNIEGIPIELPDGVSRAHYMAYKGMAAAAAPKRLIKRKSGV
jgi:uptake hydrogenase small subunit